MTDNLFVRNQSKIQYCAADAALFLFKPIVFRGLKRHGYQYVATNVAKRDWTINN
jgi:hypothetical protein